MLDKKKEKTLVNKAKRGDQDSFMKLEFEAREKVWNGLIKLVKDEFKAQDIYQQGIIKAWRKIKTFKAESRFGTWLYRICFNLAYDNFRKQSRQKEDSLEGLCESNPYAETFFVETREEPLASNKLEIKELGKKLSLTLDALSPEHREVLVLFADQDLTYEEISEKANIPIGTVMSRLFYARKKAKVQYDRLTRKESV
jgi:RNA polymerase sigma-70 factor (ECF subfamily)